MTQIQLEDQVIGVQRICKTRSISIWHRADLDTIVEAPLLEACKKFYDLNIRTWSSSANLEGGNKAYLIVDYDTMSEENKALAEQLGEIANYDGTRGLYLETPINEETAVATLSQWSIATASRFQPQQMRWAPRYTFEQLKEWYDIPKADEAKPEDFVSEGYYYDTSSKLFYMSEEHFTKYQASLQLP